MCILLFLIPTADTHFKVCLEKASGDVWCVWSANEFHLHSATKCCHCLTCPISLLMSATFAEDPNPAAPVAAPTRPWGCFQHLCIFSISNPETLELHHTLCSNPGWDGESLSFLHCILLGRELLKTVWARCFWGSNVIAVLRLLDLLTYFWIRTGWLGKQSEWQYSYAGVGTSFFQRPVLCCCLGSMLFKLVLSLSLFFF